MIDYTNDSLNAEIKLFCLFYFYFALKKYTKALVENKHSFFFHISLILLLIILMQNILKFKPIV